MLIDGYRLSEMITLALCVHCIFLQAMVLFVLNIVFIYLAYQLYSEYGWKIYKKVRMDMRLRGTVSLTKKPFVAVASKGGSCLRPH